MKDYTKSIYFEGRNYYPKGNGYYYNSHTRKHLHQAVWISYNGPIPKGCEIHHKDFNNKNNDISNLVCVTKEEHRKIHSEALTEEKRDWKRNNLDKKARPKSIEWHKSKEGKEWHRAHIQKQIQDGVINRKVTFQCSFCGKEFEGVNHKNNGNHFCSNNCKARFLRRKRASDNSDIRICICCGKEFNCSKWSKRKTCSNSCAVKLRSVTMKEKRGQ